MLDILQRYLPVIKSIKEIPGYESDEILDFGGGPGAIGELLPRAKFINYDRVREATYPQNVKFVRSKGITIDFPNNHFDISISVDTIEHIKKPEDKAAAIKEIIRVTKKRIILAIPCGKKSWNMVKKFADYYYKSTPIRFNMLDEHLEFGHPEKCKILEDIKKSDRDVTIKVVRNANIYLWYIIMVMQFKFPKIFKNKKLSDFNYLRPLFKLINFGPVLRYIFIIDKKTI